jgi:hypothetical protein
MQRSNRKKAAAAAAAAAAVDDDVDGKEPQHEPPRPAKRPAKRPRSEKSKDSSNFHKLKLQGRVMQACAILGGLESAQAKSNEEQNATIGAVLEAHDDAYIQEALTRVDALFDRMIHYYTRHKAGIVPLKALLQTQKRD